jgi:hypothetical protein
MSYFICLSLKIDEKEGRVYMTGSSNNEWGIGPNGGYRRILRESEFPSLSRILLTDGKAKLEEVLAKEAIEGNFKFRSGKFHDFTKWYWARVEEDTALRDNTSWRHHDYDGDAETELQWKENREKLLVEQWRQFLSTRKVKVVPNDAA